MEHPIRTPASHCSRSFDSQDFREAKKDCGLVNAKTYGPRFGSSVGPAGMGRRRSGRGWSKWIRVDEGE